MFFITFMTLLLRNGGSNRGKIRAGDSIQDSMLNWNGNNAYYIVWMYPFPPPNFEINDEWTVPRDQILICPYYSRSACNRKGTTVNMAELTKDKLYNAYILDHPCHELRHMHNFCHHIQAIAMISLLLKNNGALEL